MDVPIHHDGYLFCGTAKNADLLYANHKIQLAQKARVQLLDQDALRSKFRWLNGEDLALASFGYGDEGWLDSRQLLLAVRRKCAHLGAAFVEGEVSAFEAKQDNQGLAANFTAYDTALVICNVWVTLKSGEVEFSWRCLACFYN